MQSRTRRVISQEASAEKLLRMKNSIEETTKDVNILEGKLQAFKEQLTNDFNYKTLSIAQKRLDKLEKEIEQKEKALANNVRDLENEYEWD